MKREEENKKIYLTANILFSGIGCQERGFENSGLFDIEVLNTSDINKESVLSYAAIHCGMTNQMVDEYADYPSREEMARHLTDINLGYEPEKDKHFDWFKLIKRKKNDLERYWLACKLTNNLGDISRIDELPYADFWTCSFPCTDISVAGKMRGLNPDTNTRSSLLWDNIKLLNIAKDNNTLPKYIMFENVKNLVSKKFIDDFNSLIDVLDELGFNTYWSVINGKDCGVPQSRERVFVIAIRKDVDTRGFTFPQPFDTGIRLKDVLEQVVDDKYYLSDEAVKRFKPFTSSKLSSDLKQVDQIYGTNRESNPQAGRIYNDEYLSPTIDSCSGGNRMPKIIQVGRINSSQDGLVISQEGVTPTHTSGHGNVAKIIQLGQVSNDGSQAGKVYSPDGVSQTICACTHGYAIGNIWDYIRIRKLTPRETWRLMGLTFEDCDKAAALGVADTHLYKQAGNGIITNCCELLAEHLYKAQYDNTYVCTDEVYYENFTRPQVE